jgi:TetR/AcrR family transcriptional regulator, cholesterol catabolism regulator
MLPPNSEDPAKERIIEHARARFVAEGFARVSVDEITSELGMSKKTFYKFFDKKEDLVVLLVERMLGAINIRMAEVTSKDIPFPAKLGALVRLLGTVLKTMSKSMVRDLQAYVPDSWNQIQTFRREKIFTLWSDLVAEGKRTGYVRPEINQRVFLLALTSAVEGIVNPTVLTNESFSADEALETIVTVFMMGILTENAAREFTSHHHSS